MANNINLPRSNHLLQTHGVLSSFYIRRTFDKKEILELCKKLKIDATKITPEIRDKLENTLKVCASMGYFTEEIPGSIEGSDGHANSPKGDRDIKSLLMMSATISDILVANGLTPKECGFVLGNTIKNLNLNNPDYFKGFGNDTDSY